MAVSEQSGEYSEETSKLIKLIKDLERMEVSYERHDENVEANLQTIAEDLENVDEALKDLVEEEENEFTSVHEKLELLFDEIRQLMQEGRSDGLNPKVQKEMRQFFEEEGQELEVLKVDANLAEKIAEIAGDIRKRAKQLEEEMKNLHGDLTGARNKLTN
jgi:uncharacterized phage infection (PIP) family protein YhgE